LAGFEETLPKRRAISWSSLTRGLLGSGPVRSQRLFVWIFLPLILLYFGLFAVYPIFSAFFISLHRWSLTIPERPFIGLNNYSRSVIAAGPPPMGVRQVQPGPDAETSTMGWEVYPEGFYRVQARLKPYGRPVYITENGIGTDDDEQRCRFIIRSLRQVERAISEGVDVRGYLHWSFQDNFEWAEGFRQKFGLIAMEEGTRNRLPRRSAHMFRDIARGNAISDELLERYGE